MMEYFYVDEKDKCDNIGINNDIKSNYINTDHTLDMTIAIIVVVINERKIIKMN